jgi:hypothetical protein
MTDSNLMLWADVLRIDRKNVENVEVKDGIVILHIKPDSEGRRIVHTVNPAAYSRL